MHLWLKTEPKKEEPSYGTVFGASVIGKEARHMSAGYISCGSVSAPMFLVMPHSQTLLERTVAPENVYIGYTVSDMWKICFCIVSTTLINKR
jgi:hypothetical protein